MIQRPQHPGTGVKQRAVPFRGRIVLSYHPVCLGRPSIRASWQVFGAMACHNESFFTLAAQIIYLLCPANYRAPNGRGCREAGRQKRSRARAP
jgi:hypothetical protein